MLKRTNSLLNKKFKQKELVVKHLPDELVLYDEVTATAHCLSGVAADIWFACEGGKTPADVSASLAAKWPELDPEAASTSIDEMVEIGILQTSTPAKEAETTRRDLIRKIGMGAVATVPLFITSVLIPPAAAAASCATLGQTCSDTRPCCSGLGLNCRLGVCTNV